MQTIEDMIATKVEALAGVFEYHDLDWYRTNIEINNLSLDDAFTYLHRKVWKDVQHDTVKDIYGYFIDYLAKYNMRLK